MITNSWSRWQLLSVKTFSLFLITILAAAGAYYAHSYIVISREKQAYKAFAESHDFFEQAVETASKDTEKNMKLWQDVEQAFKTGYDQNSKSNLAPYFLAFQAEALIQQGKLKEAIEVTNNMLGSLKKSSPLFGLYAVKRSLMKLDMSESQIQNQGLEELISLANEEVNLNRDIALYYLGEYYWAHNEPQKARVSWSYLQNMAHLGKSPTPSPWFDLVKDRLEVA